MRWRSSLLGVVTAAALLFGQLSTVIHLLIIDHQRCPEHGELVHAAPPTSPGDAPRRRPTLLAAEAGDSHGHAHCLCVVSRREATGSCAEAAIVAAPADATATIALGAAFPTQSRCWILAPKNSPPRAV